MSRRTRTPLLGLALATFAAATPARADGPTTPAGVKSVAVDAPHGSDVVHLKDGGVVRGSLVDDVPDRPVQILLTTGEIWEIDRAYVERVERGEAPPREAPPRRQTSVRLHVDAPRRVEIIGRPDDGADWAPVCMSPCDREVPGEWEYAARGDGMRTSSNFRLRPDAGGAATVHVDPGSKATFTLGMVGVSIGAAASIVGLFLAAESAGHGTYQETVNGQTSTRTYGPELLPIGLGIAGAGAAVALVGGLIALDNRSTTVDEAPRMEPAPMPPSPQLGRVPDPVRLPPVATATLVDLRF